MRGFKLYGREKGARIGGSKPKLKLRAQSRCWRIGSKLNDGGKRLEMEVEGGSEIGAV